MTLRLHDDSEPNAREVMNALAQSAFDLQAAGFGPERAAIICEHADSRAKGIHLAKFQEFTAVLCVPCMNALVLAQQRRSQSGNVSPGTPG